MFILLISIVPKTMPAEMCVVTDQSQLAALAEGQAIQNLAQFGNPQPPNNIMPDFSTLVPLKDSNYSHLVPHHNDVLSCKN